METQEPPIGWQESLGAETTNPKAPLQSGYTLYTKNLGEHPVAPLENRIKGQFEAWVQNNARRHIKQIEIFDQHEAKEMRRAYMADIAIEAYTWDGEICKNAIHSEPGLRFLLFLLLRRCNGEMTLELAQQLLEDSPKEAGDALKWAMGNSRTPASKSKPGNPGSAGSNGKQNTSAEPPTFDQD